MRHTATAVKQITRESAAAVTTISLRIATPTPRPEKPPAPGGVGKRDERSATVGRCRRLISSLERVAARRLEVGHDYFEMRAALLTEVAGLQAIVASRCGREPERSELRRWARRHLPSSTDAEVVRAFDDAPVLDYMPRPADLGRAIGLQVNEWAHTGRPWGIHPVDLDTAQVREIQREAKRAADRARAQRKREQSGATPRAKSKSAIARRLGISRYELSKRTAAETEPEFFKFVAPEDKKKYRCDEIENHHSRRAALGPPRTWSDARRENIARLPRRSERSSRIDATAKLPTPQRSRVARWE